MADGADGNKLFARLSQVPTWLWIITVSSVVLFVGFLYYVSLQYPDQYATTQHPPRHHNMSYQNLLVYHQGLKDGRHTIPELLAQSYFSRQIPSPQIAGAGHIQQLSQTAPRKAPAALSIEDVIARDTPSRPVNEYSLAQAQNLIRSERGVTIDHNSINASLPAGIYVQAASLRSLNDASELQNRLKAMGFAPFIQEAYVKNAYWYRVRTGPYRTMSDARQAASALKAQHMSAQVVRSP